MRYGSPKVATVSKTGSEIQIQKMMGGELEDKTHTVGTTIKNQLR